MKEMNENEMVGGPFTDCKDYTIKPIAKAPEFPPISADEIKRNKEKKEKEKLQLKKQLKKSKKIVFFIILYYLVLLTFILLGNSFVAVIGSVLFFMSIFIISISQILDDEIFTIKEIKLKIKDKK